VVAAGDWSGDFDAFWADPSVEVAAADADPPWVLAATPTSGGRIGGCSPSR